MAHRRSRAFTAPGPTSDADHVPAVGERNITRSPTPTVLRPGSASRAANSVLLVISVSRSALASIA